MKGTKLNAELAVALIGLVVAVIAFVDGLRNSRGAAWTAVIVLLVAAGVALLVLRHRSRKLLPRRVFTASSAAAFVVALVVVLTVRNSPGPAAASPQTFPVDTSLVSLITVPNQNGLCDPGGLILASGVTTTEDPPGGRFALTEGTQFSLTLDPQIDSKILVTGIRTVIDGTSSAAFPGSFSAIPDECQGEPDSRYYTPDFSQQKANLVPQPGTKPLPLTVSQDDPVILYIRMPAISGTVRWHLELDWLIGSRRGTTKVGDDGNPFVSSQQ